MKTNEQDESQERSKHLKHDLRIPYLSITCI